MSFAEFVSRYVPVTPPRPLAGVKKPKPKSKRRKTRSGFHIGDQVRYRFGEGTVRSIRNYPDFWTAADNFYLYLTNGVCVEAERCTRVV